MFGLVKHKSKPIKAKEIFYFVTIMWIQLNLFPNRIPFIFIYIILFCIYNLNSIKIVYFSYFSF
jgi:hypothetical protein